MARNINFNSKHLKKGDPEPPYYEGKPRLYNMRFCPFAQRAVLALNAKKIDYQIVNINLMDKPDWFLEKNPLGKVPSFEIKEGVPPIYESLVLAEYLDEVYPQRPLLPKDPHKKAYDKIIIEVAGALSVFFYKIALSPESITEDVIKAYHKGLDFIQHQLKQRGTTFLDGSEPGFADYMIWPWFERVLSFKDYDKRTALDPVKYKLLVEYTNNMLKDPVVREYLVPPQVLMEYLEGHKNKKVNYEILNKNI